MKKHIKTSGAIDYSMVRDKLNDALSNRLFKHMYTEFSDASNGRLYSQIFKDNLIYNTTKKEWFYYDGKVWRYDAGGLTAERYGDALYDALRSHYASIKDDNTLKIVLRLGDRNKRKKMCEDARKYIHRKSEDFDSDPNLFNCENGVLNLSTMEFTEHKPAQYLSKISRVHYNPEARSPLFEKFVDEIMSGDAAKLKFLQTIMGYALTGDNQREEFYLFYGATTRNGKSTLLNSIAYMLGEYACNAQPETFSFKERSGDRPSEDLARLHGMRFVSVPEPAKRMMLDVARLKNITGGDTITARRLNENSFEFKPVCKIFFNSNHYPVVNDDTIFSSGRVKVVPFNKHFSEKEQDLRLGKKLRDPETVSAIFNWCLEGLKRCNKANGKFEVPECVKTATESYRTNSDRIYNFIEEMLMKSEKGAITFKEVYDLYKKWCDENNYYAEGKQNFKEELDKKIKIHKTGTVCGKTEYNVLIGYVKKPSLTRADWPDV